MLAALARIGDRSRHAAELAHGDDQRVVQQRPARGARGRRGVGRRCRPAEAFSLRSPPKPRTTQLDGAQRLLATLSRFPVPEEKALAVSWLSISWISFSITDARLSERDARVAGQVLHVVMRDLDPGR